VVLVGVALLAGILGVPVSATGSANTDGRSRAVRQLGARARVSLRQDTGTVRFIGTKAGQPIPRPEGVGSDAGAEKVARAFLRANDSLFGINDQAQELRLIATSKASGRRSVARFRQVHRGVPVIAGELVVGMDPEGNILQANGETTPEPTVRVTPSVGPGSARDIARRLMADEYGLAGGSVDLTEPELWIYDPMLLEGGATKTPRLVWRMDATESSRLDIRELVLVDAQEGNVLLHFNQVNEAKNRKICNANNSQSRVPCTSPFARVEGQPATGNSDVDDAYLYSGQVYDFFKSRFNRDSIDNKGMPLLQTVKYCEGSCPYENAFWNGQQMVYGPGYASADDVVGHEMAHGVTDRTAGLFYWFQSGAINESLSDVFGELLDLTNGRGNDSAAVKWKMGEDLPGGAIRSMSDPPAFGDPDRMNSTSYARGHDGFEVVDSGGVHSNSGVNNKAAYLMTDGGSFNGQTVAALGINKVAKLYYEVDANMLTSGSDYLDLYEALFQGCQNLIGSSGFTAANCTEVRDATLAVEMNQQPNQSTMDFPAVPDAPMCDTGQIPTDLFYDNMERPGSNNWTKMNILGTSNPWDYSSGYATSGKLGLYTPDIVDQSDYAIGMSTGVSISAGQTTYFRFSQAPNLEGGVYDFNTFAYEFIDGGFVEYSINNGGSWNDAGSLFTDNGYMGQISTNSNNPQEGRFAFVDTTGGHFASRVNLSSLAGSNVRLRFRLATDSGTPDGFFGWIIDDARIYTCAAGSRPGPSTSNLLRNPGFEFDDDDDGYADFWSMNTSALRTPGAGRNGSYSMGHVAADNEKYTVAQQVTGVNAGDPYSFRGYVRIPTTGKTVNFTLQVQFRNSSGGVTGTKMIKSYSNDTTGNWNRAAASMTAPSGTATAKVLMLQKGLGATVFVDDFQFKRT
jgi:bacillolysin